MRALSAGDLLEAWDRGGGLTAADRALTLLAGACPELAVEELAALPLGRRDALLLDLRELTFGPDLAAIARCAGCGEQLEAAMRASELRAEPPAAAGAGPHELAAFGWNLRFRLPDSHDSAVLAASAAGGDGGNGGAALLARCLLSAERRGKTVAAGALPLKVVRAVAARMEQLDPQAEVRIALRCPACGHRWQPVFDILAFFWAEIAAWAERTLAEVHLLASAYGWREADVLALGPQRRATYLRLASA